MAVLSPASGSHPFKRHLPGGISTPPPPPKNRRVGAADECWDISDDRWLRSVLAGDLAASSSRGTTTPSTSSVTTPAGRGFKLDVGASYRPKKGRNPLGEDAYFISDAGNAFGVADGVGSWTRRGIDAGEFARQLMSACKAQIKELSHCGITGSLLQGVLKSALAGTTARGTSTACVGAVDGPFLRVLSIGDSGFMVLRGGAVAYHSPPQHKGFNFPYQIGRVDPAYPLDRAKSFTVQLAPGDVVVAATDGLFDNLFDDDIAALVTRMRAERPRRTADEMARALAAAAVTAYTRSEDTPFAAASRAAGLLPGTGGKPDDVTAVVVTVETDETPTDVNKEQDDNFSTVDQEEERRIRLWMNGLWTGNSATETN